MIYDMPIFVVFCVGLLVLNEQDDVESVRLVCRINYV
jgi:hypothetical protein